MVQQDKDEPIYLINAVSRLVGLSQKRLREYEKGGLIRPTREPKTNNRRYTAKDIRQIQRIKQLIHDHGFTVACLRHFLAHAACWVIFECDQKERCPSYGSSLTPCYDVVRQTAAQCETKPCESCPIYLNRHVQRITLLEK